MNVCALYKETLVLDVHGELPPAERGAWQRHLANCAACRQQSEQLRALIRNAQETMRVPALTLEEVQVLSDRAQRALRAAKADARPAWIAWWLAPACATCMVLLVAGWFGLKNSTPDTAAIAIERVPAEVIRLNKELPANSDRVAAGTIEPVPASSLRADAGLTRDADQAAGTSDARADIPPVDRELLENFGLLQEMEDVEELVRLLDKQELKTS